MTDPHDLDRFVSAQEGVIDRALSELRGGAKRSHWMWFVFPQFEGLGSSPVARRYAIRSLDEARAFLSHPVLGPRLHAALDAAMASGVADPARLFGAPDDLKLRSCLTLFHEAADNPAPFDAALARFFAGRRDPRTLELLRRA